MSTNAFVGKGTQTHFQARYVHWNGYPTSLGRSLFEAARDQFGGDPTKLVEIIMAHGPGWSDLSDVDFSQTPGYIALGGKSKAAKLGQEKRDLMSAFYDSIREELDTEPKLNLANPDYDNSPSAAYDALWSARDYVDSLHPITKRPQCYCHGDRKEREGHLITDYNWGNVGFPQWGYLFDTSDPERPLLRVYAVGEHRLFEVSVFNLKDPDLRTPDWKWIEGFPERAGKLMDSEAPSVPTLVGATSVEAITSQW